MMIAESTCAQDPHLNCPKLMAQSSCENSDTCVSHCAAYGHVCPCHARAAAKVAHKKVARILSNSELFPSGHPNFKTIDGSDLLMGEKLGEGGFSCVHSCALKSAPLDENLAVKFLKRRAMVDRKTFEFGAADLATEACFLSLFDHPNIVKLHGVTAGTMESNVSSGKDAGFFIVVDRLVETLEDRIERWRHQSEELSHRSMFYRMSKEYKEKQQSLLVERIETALKVAVVMEYLHDQNILFRDLKPDNIGFDARGTLKLFDFGLAREAKECDALENGTYKMSGHTGSRRYMAPEVARGKAYNKSVDVYSFGILLWEMCSLEKPYMGYSSKRHMKDVVLGGERPKMDGSHIAHWPLDLQWIMTSSWSTNANTRPSFTAIIQTLHNILVDLQKPSSERVRAVSEGSALHSSPQKRTRNSWKSLTKS